MIYQFSPRSCRTSKRCCSSSHHAASISLSTSHHHLSAGWTGLTNQGKAPNEPSNNLTNEMSKHANLMPMPHYLMSANMKEFAWANLFEELWIGKAVPWMVKAICRGKGWGRVKNDISIVKIVKNTSSSSYGFFLALLWIKTLCKSCRFYIRSWSWILKFWLVGKAMFWSEWIDPQLIIFYSNFCARILSASTSNAPLTFTYSKRKHFMFAN